MVRSANESPSGATARSPRLERNSLASAGPKSASTLMTLLAEDAHARPRRRGSPARPRAARRRRLALGGRSGRRLLGPGGPPARRRAQAPRRAGGQAADSIPFESHPAPPGASAHSLFGREATCLEAGVRAMRLRAASRRSPRPSSAPVAGSGIGVELTTKLSMPHSWIERGKLPIVEARAESRGELDRDIRAATRGARREVEDQVEVASDAEEKCRPRPSRTASSRLRPP